MDGEIMLAGMEASSIQSVPFDEYARLVEGYNQSKFIAKAGELLETHYKGSEKPEGYCNGLASLWAYKKAQGKEDEFFQIYASIINWDKSTKPTEAMACFIDQVAYLQSPQTYSDYADFTQTSFEDSIIMLNIDSFRVKSDFNLCFNFSKNELGSTLNKLSSDHSILFFRSPKHTVAAIKKGEVYFYYNANIGLEMEIEKEQLTDKLFKDLNADHCGKYLPLRIEAYSDQASAPVAYPKALGIVQELLTADPDFERNDAWPEDNALVSAVSVGDLETVNYLISNGAKVSTEVVQVAAFENQFETIKLLHKLGFDVSDAILIYASNNFYEHIQELIDIGLDANYTASDGYCALEIAIEAGNYNSVETLLKAGAWFAGANTLSPSSDQARIVEILDRYAKHHHSCPFAAVACLAVDAARQTPSPIE
jgi:hypothetical protein